MAVAAFAAHESTHVEVSFSPTAGGTLITVCHRGWEALRPDHPARHAMHGAELIRVRAMWWGDLLTALRMHVKQSSSR